MGSLWGPQDPLLGVRGQHHKWELLLSLLGNRRVSLAGVAGVAWACRGCGDSSPRRMCFAPGTDFRP